MSLGDSSGSSGEATASVDLGAQPGCGQARPPRQHPSAIRPLRKPSRASARHPQTVTSAGEGRRQSLESARRVRKRKQGRLLQVLAKNVRRTMVYQACAPIGLLRDSDEDLARMLVYHAGQRQRRGRAPRMGVRVRAVATHQRRECNHDRITCWRARRSIRLRPRRPRRGPSWLRGGQASVRAEGQLLVFLGFGLGVSQSHYSCHNGPVQTNSLRKRKLEQVFPVHVPVAGCTASACDVLRVSLSCNARRPTSQSSQYDDMHKVEPQYSILFRTTQRILGA